MGEHRAPLTMSSIRVVRVVEGGMERVTIEADDGQLLEVSLGESGGSDPSSFLGQGQLARSFGCTVTGDGTSFEREVTVGNKIRCGSQVRTVVSIASRSTLVVDEPFNPPITTNQGYNIEGGAAKAASAYRVRTVKGGADAELGTLPAAGAVVDHGNLTLSWTGLRFIFSTADALHNFLAALPSMKTQAIFSGGAAPMPQSPAPGGVGSPSTERIKELSDRLESLRSELVSERARPSPGGPVPGGQPMPGPAYAPVYPTPSPVPPPRALNVQPSPSQNRIDQLADQLSTLRAELDSNRGGQLAAVPAPGPGAASPQFAYARPGNMPPAAVPTTVQGVYEAPGDFNSPSKVRVVTVNDTLQRVQDAFTNERRINDEVANSKLLVVDNLITQTAALRVKKIDEIRDLADKFVDELNRMREEDKVREMVYADLFFQTKTALQRAIQEEEDQRKLLEEGLQLQITDMMDAIKVEIDRDNRERERSEEARREKFQRDALKIRETLDDDRAKRIEAAATLSKAMDDQFADLQYNVDNERQDLKDLDTRMTTEIQSRLTQIELELQQEVEDRTYVQDKREDLVKEGLQLIKEKLTNEQNHRGLSYDRILKKIDLDISQTSANIRSQTMMRESSESSLIHVMENLAIQVKEELKAEKLERKKTDVGLIRVLEDTFTTYN